MDTFSGMLLSGCGLEFAQELATLLRGIVISSPGVGSFSTLINLKYATQALTSVVDFAS